MHTIKKRSAKLDIIGFINLKLILISAWPFLFLLTTCQHNSLAEEKELHTTAPEKGDTINVTKYSVRSEVSYALKDWIPFVINDATIFAPSDWKIHKIDSVIAIMPANKADSNEGIFFTRYVQNLDNAGYDKFVKELYRKFSMKYRIIEEDKLKKMQLDRGVIYEKNFKLMKGRDIYQGYLFIYNIQSHIYEYNIVFMQSRLNNYDGSLTKDITGNLSVGGADILGENNQIKKIMFIE